MIASPLGRIAINIAPVIAHLLTQSAPLFRRHALTARSTAGLAALTLLPAALRLIAAMGLALGAPLIRVAARATATARPARARLRPHRLRGGENSQSNNDDKTFHDVRLTLRYTGS